MPITLANSTPPRLDWQRHAALARPLRPAPPAPASDRDAEFVALQAAYRPHGGIVRAESLAGSMSASGSGGYVELARRLVAGQLFSFRWNDGFWLPVFQLDPDSHDLLEAPRRVLDELQGVFDGWGLTRWHVQPHAALAGLLPLDLLSSDLPVVLAAARSDRRAAQRGAEDAAGAASRVTSSR